MAIAKTIIGSLGDLGLEIMKETAKVPGEIVGAVVQTPHEIGSKQPLGQEGKAQATPNAFKDLDHQDQTQKRQNARRALQQFVGYGEPAKKEPSIHEKNIAEKDEKKRILADQRKREEKHTLQPIPSKRKTGQRFGLGVKTNIEKQRDVKAE